MDAEIFEMHDDHSVGKVSKKIFKYPLLPDGSPMAPLQSYKAITLHPFDLEEEGDQLVQSGDFCAAMCNPSGRIYLSIYDSIYNMCAECFEADAKEGVDFKFATPIEKVGV